MDQNIKNNKNSALIPQYTYTDICDITVYFCSFTIIEKGYVPFYLMLGGCYVFYFYFYFTLLLFLPSKIFSENVRKPINKK